MVAIQFLLTALLWGGGALMTAFQAGIVPAPVSVGYRMTLVGGILLLAGRLTGARLRLGRGDAAHNQRNGMPTLSVMGWGALIGAAVACAWSVAASLPFAVDTSLRYIASFSYLVILASCAAFLLYFDLVRRIGPARTSYMLALVPVIALILSALFEGLALDMHVLLGAIVILLGNVLVLSR